ncbi:hypothetical protein [Pseudomonas delhiensis]|uniref:hypothetical protein n=1 Tax=Pseudomonas delhiensis TaxID=366289 RepID=UPI0028B6B8AD
MSLDTIKTLVDELTTLHITRGVQPGDLADNIFEDSYVTSSSRKTPTGAQFEMTFQEVDEDDQVSQVTMRYTYDQSRYLLLVEQKVAGKRFVVQWDRAACIKGKVDQLEVLLSAELPKARVKSILATIPCDFLKLFPKLQLVA